MQLQTPSIIDKMSKLQALSLTNVSEPIQYVALQALDSSQPFEAVARECKNYKAKIRRTELKLQKISV